MYLHILYHLGNQFLNETWILFWDLVCQCELGKWIKYPAEHIQIHKWPVKFIQT